jgi:hypothetical protein
MMAGTAHQKLKSIEWFLLRLHILFSRFSEADAGAFPYKPLYIVI